MMADNDQEAPMHVVTHSVVTCPDCGATSEHEMPTDACTFFLQCTSCAAMLRPKPGDCCVYCSYGSVKCPPMQRQGDCCRPTRESPPEH